MIAMVESVILLTVSLQSVYNGEIFFCSAKNRLYAAKEVHNARTAKAVVDLQPGFPVPDYSCVFKNGQVL
jgi:hypothetical protein